MGTWSPRKTELEGGGEAAGRWRHPFGFSYHQHHTQSVFNARVGQSPAKIKRDTSEREHIPGPPLYLPVLSDGRAGVGQSQIDLHVALLLRVAPHPCHEPLHSAVLRLEVEMR